MTYNIQHGRGMDGKINLERIATVILREGADIVALQEVDRGVERTDRRDLAAELGALTGMTPIFSNNFHFQGGEYGNAILTRFPVITWSNTHLARVGQSEQRGVLQAVLEVHGRPLLLMNTHIDHRKDDAERLLNIQEFLNLREERARLPVIFGGDFNDVPGSPVHQEMSRRFLDVWELAGTGPGFTFSSVTPRARIDYIWISKDAPWQVLKAWAPRSTASDHLPVVAEFQWE
jgi:endonuclease/exonuclease/phosphatase family metal-dependent hydrolase